MVNKLLLSLFSIPILFFSVQSKQTGNENPPLISDSTIFPSQRPLEFDTLGFLNLEKRPFKKPKTERFESDEISISGNIEILLNKIPKTVSSFDSSISQSINLTVSGIESNYLWPAAEDVFEMGTSEYASSPYLYLNTDRGLPTNYVWDISQDTEGFWWLGTYGNGLIKYSGNKQQIFTEENGLSSDFINVILADSKGLVWIGTDKGLDIYDGEKLTSYTSDNNRFNDKVWDIYEDREGNIWLGTENGVYKVLKLKDSEMTLQYLGVEQGIIHNIVWEIYQDKQGNFWFGTQNGITKYDPPGILGSESSEDSRFTNFTLENGFPVEEIWAIQEDKFGNLWFGSNSNGLLKFDPEENVFNVFNTENNFPSDWVWDLEEDHNGDIWIGTYGEGIVKLNLSEDESESFFHYENNKGLKGEFVTSIKEGKNGAIWLSTYGSGINKLNARLNIKQFYTEDSGLSSQFIQAIFEDSFGSKWLAPEEGGLYKMDTYDSASYNLSYFNLENGLSGEIVWTIMEDHNNNLWVGTSQGITIMYRENGEIIETATINKKNGLKDYYVTKLFQDSENNIWIGTSLAGLYKINTQTNRLYHFKYEEFQDKFVYDIDQDVNSSVWVSLYNIGLVKIDNHSNKYQIFTEDDGLNRNTIANLFLDSNGFLWAGTEGKGINVIDPVSLEIISIKDQLSNLYAWEIIEDKNNNLWIGTENGLNLIQNISNKSFDDLRKSNFSISHFNKMDGLKSTDFYPEGSLMDKNGILWWCTGKGIFKMDPTKYDYDLINQKPIIHFNDLRLLDESVDFRRLKSDTGYFKNLEYRDIIMKTYDSILNSTNLPLNLQLPHFINDLTVEVSAIHWNSGANLNYRYKLENFDDDWSNPTTKSFVTYTNLPSGKFNLHVKSSTKDGLESDMISYPFTINPPWWLTWWAYILEFLFISLLIVGIIRIRTYSLEKNKKTLKRKIKERTIDLENSLQETIKTQKKLVQSEKMASIGLLSAGIAHELKNPINAILNGTKVLEKDIKDLNQIVPELCSDHKNTNSEISEILQSLKNNLGLINIGASQTTNIIRSLRSYSRIDDEVLVEGDIHQSLENALTLHDSKIKHEIKVEKDYEKGLEKILCYYGQLSQVFMNILSNAIDAIQEAGVDGIIKIKTRSKEERVIIEISDNGTGIPIENQKKIFNPFYTSKEVGHGTGIGLSISQDIILKHKGNILCDSEPGKGTKFVISIPTNLNET